MHTIKIRPRHVSTKGGGIVGCISFQCWLVSITNTTDLHDRLIGIDLHALNYWRQRTSRRRESATHIKE